MKINLCLVSLATAFLVACNSSGGSSANTDIPASPQSHSLNECPALQGDYTKATGRKSIYEKRDNNTYRVTLGEGAQEMIIDGATHPHPETAGVSYKGLCEKSTLKIEITSGNEKGVLKLYFSQPNILIEELSGFGNNSSEQWQKVN